MGALSSTNTTYTLPLELREALGLPYDRPTGPYAKRSLSRTEYANGLRALEVPAQLSTNEAAALFEVWSRNLASHTGAFSESSEKQVTELLTLFSAATDEVFLSKFTESNGNARYFVWKGLLATLE